MRLRSMDPYEYPVLDLEDESEDVMDLDETEVISLLDINHEMLPRDEGIGFEAWLDERLDALDTEEDLDDILDQMDTFDLEGDI